MAQAENTQALVLQQPNGQKVYLDLTHSTDTTAIWSFGVAMVIAIGLGSLATWLAYWYGKRSFDLTKQSFAITIEQIKSSERIMMKSNQALIKSQYEQLITTHKIDEFNKVRDEFKSLLVDFLTESESLSTYIGFTAMESVNIDFSKHAQEGAYSYEIFKELQKRLKIIQSLKVKISFETFYYVNNYDTEVNAILTQIVKKGASLNNDLFDKSDKLLEEVQKYREHVEKFKIIAKHLLKNEIVLEKFRI